MPANAKATNADHPLSPQAKWDRANPEARWAHMALASAIRRGLIERQPCEICGAVHGQGGTVIHGHHGDYQRPMAVQWLCQLHHRQVHAVLRALKGSVAAGRQAVPHAPRGGGKSLKTGPAKDRRGKNARTSTNEGS